MEFLGIRTKSGAVIQPNSGEEMIRKFDFAYSTPGLSTGVVVYNPTVGDILLDAWIEIDTAFNGTTPMADIGNFLSGNIGWFANDGNGPVDLGQNDTPQLDPTGSISQPVGIDWVAAGPTPSAPVAAVTLTQALNVFPAIGGGAFTHIRLNRIVPAKITVATPIKLVVSQNGQKGGTATGATQGAGAVYFLTGTPQ